MAKGYSGGTFTINPSGPGVLAGSTITHTLCTATSNIGYTVTTRSEDAEGNFNHLIITPGSGTFTATCNKRQLKTTLTGNYVLVNTA